MIRLVIMLITLAVGFGGGVYWAHRNPEAAAKLAAEQEKRFLEAQLEFNKRLKDRLASLEGKTETKSGASGFLSGNQAATASKQEVNELKAEAEKQEQDLLKRMEELKAK